MIFLKLLVSILEWFKIDHRLIHMIFIFFFNFYKRVRRVRSYLFLAFYPTTVSLPTDSLPEPLLSSWLILILRTFHILEKISISRVLLLDLIFVKSRNLFNYFWCFLLVLLCFHLFNYVLVSCDSSFN